MGFVLAAAIAGWIAQRRRDAGGVAAAVVAGMLAIHACGVLWPVHIVGFAQALQPGVAPFVWGDLLKGTLAFALALGGAAMVRRRAGV